MKNILRNVIKEALIFAIVGAVLAIAAPYIGVMAGLGGGDIALAAKELGHSANPAWLGSFFGAFGAMVAVTSPAITRLMGNTSADTAIRGKSEEPQRVQELGKEMEFAKMIEAERVRQQSRQR